MLETETDCKRARTVRMVRKERFVIALVCSSSGRMMGGNPSDGEISNHQM